MSAPTRPAPARNPARRERASVTSLADRRPVAAPPPEPPPEPPRPRRRRSAAPPGRRSTTFVTLLGLVFVLNMVGLAMILSASSVESMTETGSPWSRFLRQLLWFGVGTVALICAMRRDYRRWRSTAGWGLLVGLVLLVLVVVPGVGTNAGGATRWLGVGMFTIQPAELAKLILIVFWADLLARRAKWIEHPRLTVVPVLVTFAVAGALIMKQPNLGTTMVLFVIMLGMLFVAGAPLRWVGAIVAAGIAGATVFTLLSPWRRARVGITADPSADAANVGYQPVQAMAAAADGGWLGVGLGQSRAKWSYLPEADNDFIFAVLAEEAGLVGALLIIALFIALAVVGTRVAMRSPDRFGMLLAAGITTWFLVQAFLNIGQAVGRLPVVGVPLPFVSSGGSSLVVSMFAAGMLLNIARQTR
jgi:cell division protein FtsW